jgi:hypothetical protein
MGQSHSAVGVAVQLQSVGVAVQLQYECSKLVSATVHHFLELGAAQPATHTRATALSLHVRTARALPSGVMP